MHYSTITSDDVTSTCLAFTARRPWKCPKDYHSPKVPCAAAFPLISGITATFQGGAQWPKPQNSAAFPLISRITAVFPNPILKIWRRSRLDNHQPSSSPLAIQKHHKLYNICTM